jgi:hypothetical protein
MKLTGKPNTDGTVDFYAGGRKIENMRVKQNSARISDGQIEAVVFVTCEPYVDKKKEVVQDATESADQADLDS